MVEFIAADLRGRQIEQHFARAQPQDAREVRERRVDLMHRRQQRDAALARNRDQLSNSLLRAGRIERGQRLIHQPERSGRQQRARESDPLPLAAGQPVDPREQLLAQIEPLERRVRARNVLRIEQRAQTGAQAPVRQPAREHRRDHALARRQRRHLRGHEKPPALLLQCACGLRPDVGAAQHDAPGRGLQRRAGGLQQRGLACAGRADHRDLLARLHLQRHPTQRRGAARGRRVARMHAVQFEFQALGAQALT